MNRRVHIRVGLCTAAESGFWHRWKKKIRGHRKGWLAWGK